MSALEGVYPSQEIQSFFNILVAKYLSLSRIEIALNPKITISELDLELFYNAISQLKEQKPIQYIIGETEFYGLLFKVNENTLIPRPETEELVDWIVSEYTSNTNQVKPLSIIDIGTGSGCIAISLAKNIQNSKVHAIDISSEAIKIAQENAVLNKVEIDFFETDILKLKSLSLGLNNEENKFDIIVSNPPYVLELEKESMQPNVLDFEPETALFVPDRDPLLFYRAISLLAKTALKIGGSLFFEINESFSHQMKVLLNKEGFKNIEIRKDIYNKDRMIKCSL